MLRIAALLLFAATLPALAQENPIAPALRDRVTVESDIVRIGDLVENAGAASAIAIFRAPDLGETGGVPVARVLDALRPHGVVGLNTRGLTEVVVTRNGRSITLKDIETRIAQVAAGHHGFGDAKSLTVTLDREARGLNVEAAATADLVATRTNVDARSGRFEIVFDLPGSAVARRQTLRYTGSIVESVDVVSVLRPIARGEILRASDMSIERRPKSEAAGDSVPGAAQAIGLAARQPIRSGQLLRRTDLMKPELVARNETVTILYEVPGVTVTLRGKALDGGAEGDVVNVMNLQSKRTLQGVVTGPGRVAANSVTPRFAENTALFSNAAPSAAR